MLIHLNAQTSKYHSDILDDFYKIRKKIFIDRLDWDLPSQEDKEIDQFDHDQCDYLILVENNRVKGGIRLTPTKAPNLTLTYFRDIFNLPKDILPSKDLLEISRFGLDKNCNERNSSILKKETLEIFQGILKFGLCFGYKKIITVTDVRIERIFKLAGWPLKRISDVQQVGNTRALVGLLDITQDCYQKLQDKIDQFKTEN